MAFLKQASTPSNLRLIIAATREDITDNVRPILSRINEEAKAAIKCGNTGDFYNRMDSIVMTLPPILVGNKYNEDKKLGIGRLCKLARELESPDMPPCQIFLLQQVKKTKKCEENKFTFAEVEGKGRLVFFNRNLGKGSTSRVKQVSIGHETLAIKKMEGDCVSLKDIAREAHLNGIINSDSPPMVVRYFSAKKGIVIGLISQEGVPLQQGVERWKPEDQRRRFLNFARKVLPKIQAMSEAKITYHDLKTDNIILLNEHVSPEDPQVSIIDFGLANIQFRSCWGGTYPPPFFRYMINSEDPDLNGVDKWGLGIVLLQVVMTCLGISHPIIARETVTLLEQTRQKINEQKEISCEESERLDKEIRDGIQAFICEIAGVDQEEKWRDIIGGIIVPILDNPWGCTFEEIRNRISELLEFPEEGGEAAAKRRCLRRSP